MIIAVTGQKGGAGKTTTAIAIATEAMQRGRRVLIVDADPQQSAGTWHTAAMDGGHPAPTVIAMTATMHRPEQLPRIASLYDLVIIDCPPRHGDVQRSALMIADLALLPVGPTSLDAWALTTTLDLVREAQIVRPELRAAILITRIQKGTAGAKNARKALAEAGLPILKAALHYRVAYQDCMTVGMGVTAYDRRDAALEVRKLVDEIETLDTTIRTEAAE